MPLHEQHHSFLGQTEIGGSGIGSAKEIITCRQIRLLPLNDRTHDTTGPIPLILRFGFEHIPRTVDRLTGSGSDGLFVCGPRTGSAVFIASPIGTAVHLSVLVVRTHTIDLTVRRQHMENIVSDTACSSTPPRLRDRVLTVITVTNTIIVTAGIGSSKHALTVHVPNLTGFAYRVRRIHIGLEIRGIQTVVTDRFVVLGGSRTHCRPEGRTRLTIYT